MIDDVEDHETGMHLGCGYERLSFKHAAHSHSGGVDKHACLAEQAIDLI